MKTTIRTLMVLLCIITCMANSNAQVATDTILCGSDTVSINLDNYHFGKVSWEESADGTHWVTIPNIFDTAFRYFTKEEKYIRACITTADCEQVYSHRVFIRQVPQAFAGSDKEVMLKYINLKGNEMNGASRHWDMLRGFGGTIAEQDSAKTLFELGEDPVYELTYTLENECGASTDTITVSYIQNRYNANHIVVDSSDTIEYQSEDTMRISFGPMKWVDVKDSVVLVSGLEDGFLRKVSSYEQLDENTFVFRTEEGSLADILEEGLLNLGEDILLDPNLEKSSGNKYMLDHMPTREELSTDPKYKEGVFVYQAPDRYEYSPAIKSVSVDGDGFVFDITKPIEILGDSDSTHLNLILDGRFRFDPNFVCNVKVGFIHLKYLKAGMENAELDTRIKATIVGVLNGDSLIGKDLRKNIFKKTKPYTIIAGGFPIVITNTFSCDFVVEPKLRAEINASFEWTRYTSFSAYLEKKRGQKLKGVYEKGATINSTDFEIQFKGSAGVDLTLEPRVDVKLYGILGPYLAVPVSLGPEVCTGVRTPSEDNDTQYSWGFNVPLSIDARIGCALKIRRWALFDRSLTFNLYQSGFYYPASVGISTGNYQQALIGQPLVKPLSVKLKTTWGFPAYGIPVYFKVVKGDAVLEKELVHSQAGGLASTRLTMGDSLYNRIQVEAFNCDFDLLAGGENLYFEVNSACKNSSLALQLNFLEDETVRLQGIMGQLPYTYSMDGISFSEEITDHPNIYNVIDQPLYVKDANGCTVSNQVSEMDTCRYSALSVQISQEAKYAIALGEFGTAPYEYSLDNAFSYSSNNEFSYLDPGYHEIFIRDNSGCQDSLKFEVKIEMTDSLVAFYPFNGDAMDESGNFHHGLVDGAILASDRFDRENSSYLFNGSNIITVPSSENFEMEEDFSISFWTYSMYEPSHRNQVPLSFGNRAENNGLHLTFSSLDNPLQVHQSTDAPPLYLQDQIIEYEVQSWHHFALVRRADQLIVYCDGEQLGSMIVVDTLFKDCDLHFGNNSGKDQGLNGGLDDIRIYNRVLFPSEISGLYKENGWKGGILTDYYTDPRDDNAYNQVRIGEQVWMAENLRWLPEVCPTEEDCGYHVYNYQGADSGDAMETWGYNTYGVLYNYEQAADACPAGWHMPAQEDWTELIEFIGGEEGYEWYGAYPIYYNVGKNLRTERGWSAGESASDNYFFSALPAGVVYGGYEYQGYSAFYWMQENIELGGEYSYIRMSQYDDLIIESSLYSDESKSLRCIRDEVVKLPIVSTDPASTITRNSVRSGGLVLDDGGGEILASGICWSTSPNPDTSLTTKTSDLPEEGHFYSYISGLDPETLYYVRAFAVNSEGISYGGEISFTTMPAVSDSDGNSYSMVRIGGQVWMAENLRTTSYNDGIPIDHTADDRDWNALQSGSYCWYDNDSANHENSYGKLYNWYVVSTDKICPSGWHVPDNADWNILFDFLGGLETAGGKLKEAGTEHWQLPNSDASNNTGFTALPGGYRFVGGNFEHLGTRGYGWSATEYLEDGLDLAYVWWLNNDNSNVNNIQTYKNDGYSVRCVQDD